MRTERKITQLDTTETLKKKLVIAREFQMQKEYQQIKKWVGRKQQLVGHLLEAIETKTMLSSMFQ